MLHISKLTAVSLSQEYYLIFLYITTKVGIVDAQKYFLLNAKSCCK